MKTYVRELAGWGLDKDKFHCRTAGFRFPGQGQSGMADGICVVKADLHVEAYRTVDEHQYASLARSICQNKEIAKWTEQIQSEVFSRRLRVFESAAAL